MHVGAELCISIEDHVLVVATFWECFARLLHDPEMDDFSAALPNQK
jgi:hypothetical protein